MKTCVILLLSALLLEGCRECATPNYYQIRRKTQTPESSWKCEYMAQGIGTCSTFQSPPEIVFSDSCKMFLLSQIVPAARLTRYR